MRLTVLASTLLFTVAAAASAQAPAAPAAPAAPVPVMPRALPVPAVPELPVADLPELHIDLPQFHFDVPEFQLDAPFPLVDFNRFDREPFHVAGVQKDKGKDVVVTVPGPFTFKYQGSSQIENVYSQARNWIDSDQYDRALEPLDRVITAKSDRADAAMYWKAYSLMKLARRDEALSTLGQLTKQYPESGWVRDARALEVEVKQAAGQNVSADVVDDETKLLALQGIMRTDPDRALAAVEKLLAGGGSVRLKDRALFVLSQSRNDRALGIISNVARTNGNPDLKQRAVRYLGQSNSPEAISTLTAVYRAENSVETKKGIISALATSRNTAAISALVSLARAERNPELKNSMVRYLSNSKAPEALQLMEDILK